MINYIKAELYRNFNRAYFWVYTGIISALLLTIVILFNVSSIPSINLSAIIQISNHMVFIPVFLVAGTIEMVIAEEYKNKTLKNVITFGLPRTKLILSKFIVTVILSFIAAIIMLTVFYGSAAVLLGLGNGFHGIFLDHIARLAAALPLWIAAIAVGIFLNVVISNSTICAFVYAGVFLMTSQIVKLLAFLVSNKFKYVYDNLITIQLSKLGGNIVSKQDLTSAAIIGCIYTIIFLIFSIVYFRKKEVK